MERKVCLDCGTTDVPQNLVKGDLLTEIILWLLLGIPGMIYTVWRITTRTKVCPTCGSERMIPLHTPRARYLQRRYYPKVNNHALQAKLDQVQTEKTASENSQEEQNNE